MLSCEKKVWKSTELEKRGKVTGRGLFAEREIVGISVIPKQKHWHDKDGVSAALRASNGDFLASTDLLHDLQGIVSI